MVLPRATAGSMICSDSGHYAARIDETEARALYPSLDLLTAGAIGPIGQAHIVELIAPQYRDVNFIIPHLGSFADDWRAHQQVVDQLVRHANVYADTAGVRRFDYIVQAVERAGAHKVLFGSDGPWLHPGLELHKIRLLRLPPNKEALILGGNILRLLRHSGSRGFPHHDETSLQQIRSL